MSKIYKFKQDKIDSSSIVHRYNNGYKDLSVILNEPIVVDNYLENISSLNANTNQVLTFNIEKNNYIPIAVAGFSCSSHFLNIYVSRINSNTEAQISLRNIGTSKLSNIGVRIYILYVKNS